MQLQFVDKKKYRNHLNLVIFAFIATLLTLSLVYGALLIKTFSDLPNQIGFMSNTEQQKELNTDIDVTLKGDGISSPNTEQLTQQDEPPTSNFKYNLLGVVLALITCIFLLSKFRRSDFFKEIYYVWQLKQVQNQIFRKLKNIKKAVKEDDKTAMLILTFYYEGLKQVYELDDNTITMGTIHRDIDLLKDEVKQQGVTIEITDFDVSLLKGY
jgi:hypothetical protein